MLSLQMLLEKLIALGRLKPTRIAPMRTAVKQYAAILGSEPQLCLPEHYHLSDPLLTTLINTNAPARLGPDARRNLRNNIRFLLKTSVAEQLLLPLETPATGWRETRAIPRGWSPHREEGINYERYALRPLPPSLAAEFQRFSAWSTTPYSPGRPSRLKKRLSSMEHYHETVRQMAGFLVRQCQMKPEELALYDLIRPKHVEAFAHWKVQRRGMVTRTVHKDVSCLEIISRWLQDEVASRGLRTILRELPPPHSVREKHRAWISLRELEAAGVARYPLSAGHLREVRHDGRRILAHASKEPGPPRPRRNYTFVSTAAWVEHSLIMRLFLRIPIRQRNMREMQLRRHLVQLPDGHWEVRFRGDDLKVGWRRGRVHEVVYQFPLDLEGLLEEWLSKWRPLLIKAPDEPHVFVSKSGKPYTDNTLWSMICRLTYKFTGVAVNPHMIRDIWATEYIKSTRDIAGAAYMLGNTVQIILRYYAHLLDAEAEQKATQWLQSRLT